MKRDMEFHWSDAVDLSGCNSGMDVLHEFSRACAASLFRLLFADRHERSLRVCGKVISNQHSCDVLFVARSRAVYCPGHRSALPTQHRERQASTQKERAAEWHAANGTERRKLVRKWFPTRGSALLVFLKTKGKETPLATLSFWNLKKKVNAVATRTRHR
ncbi:MAG: hypothetical protein IPP14_05750 [Planctomycetes bacterium]|nr:hypothetical protein [Planctomycetota bacterium]